MFLEFYGFVEFMCFLNFMDLLKRDHPDIYFHHSDPYAGFASCIHVRFSTKQHISTNILFNKICLGHKKGQTATPRAKSRINFKKCITLEKSIKCKNSINFGKSTIFEKPIKFKNP